MYKYIDEHYELHLGTLQELLRQPSISAENQGIRECAELIRRYLTDLGCDTSSIVGTSGHPVVFGTYDAEADKTIIIYLMYDTQPVDEPGWIVPPLDGQVIDFEPFGHSLVARGACNTKGELRAFLNACESITAAGEEIPVNLMFVAEGEEELGSRHLPEFIEQYVAELRTADAVFFPSASQNQKGKIVMSLGVKGIVYFELELDGGTWGFGPSRFDIHGSNKAWVDSPAWRHINMLASLQKDDGNTPLIRGFFDNKEMPTPADVARMKARAANMDLAAQAKALGVARYIWDDPYMVLKGGEFENASAILVTGGFSYKF